MGSFQVEFVQSSKGMQNAIKQNASRSVAQIEPTAQGHVSVNTPQLGNPCTLSGLDEMGLKGQVWELEKMRTK